MTVEALPVAVAAPLPRARTSNGGGGPARPRLYLRVELEAGGRRERLGELVC
jgi:hypothetical protein